MLVAFVFILVIILNGGYMDIKINGYYLDNEQMKIVLDNSKHLLVTAGAGSGKTLTILGKIYYLIHYKKISPNQILCISFTRTSANNLKEKIRSEFKIEMPVYTFHKLSLEILKEEKKNYEIADSNTLENIIHEFFMNTILDYPRYMKLVLYYFNQHNKNDIKEVYFKFYKKKKKEIQLMESLISTFLHLMKCNNYSFSSFLSFIKQAKKTFFYNTYKKEKIFLMLALNIYLIYQDYLQKNREIDFDDMILYATNYVNQYGIHSSYQYIIIDEYQDTSLLRFNLVKAILNKTSANLMVVGDDFQSIYRFTGCDLSLFLNFKNYFSDANTMKIENTYRNSQELIKIAGNFVMRNKKQIRKDLHSNKHLDFPILIVYYQEIKSKFIQLIETIYYETRKPILILGRNNKDIYLVLSKDFQFMDNGDIIYNKNRDVKLKFLTVHKSKGLEAENVIIINLEDSFLGFPNKIKDDKVLRFVSKNFEKYPYSEERRLFYVALTRTKNKVYLLVPYKNKSIFVSELLKKDSKMIKIVK